MFERTALAEGPRVISSRVPGARSVSIAAYVLAGSRLESAAEAGVAHFMEHLAFVPLKVRCSMKWATPASAALSRREPARTYAAMETERAPGTRELMTRGPSASAVRSNIATAGTGRSPLDRPSQPRPNGSPDERVATPL